MSDNIGTAALKAFAERRIRLEDEKDALAEDISAVNAEAKSAGYSPRVFNAAVKRARMSPEKRAEAERMVTCVGGVESRVEAEVPTLERT